MPNWSLQVTYRSLKNLLIKSLEKTSSSDMSHVALFDLKGQLIHVEGPHPLHYLGFSQTVGFIQKYLKFSPEEVIVTNDLAAGSPRLCDLNFITGIYDGRDLRAYAAVQISIDGLLNTPHLFQAKTIDNEGFRIPPTPLALGVQSALFDYLSASGVPKEKLKLCFEEALSCLKFLKEGYLFQEKRWGKQSINEKLADLSKYTETLLKSSLHRFPDGEYTAQIKIQKETLSTRLKVKGESFSVDFLGTSKATEEAYNLSYTATLSSCFWFFLSLVEDEVPINVGVLRTLTVEAPTGTLVNPPPQSACLEGYYKTSQFIVKNLMTILSQAIPQEFSQSFVKPLLITSIKTKDHLMIESYGVGTDATALKDGFSALKTGFHNLASWSVEKQELDCNIKFLRRSLRMQSQSETVHRGGRGITQETVLPPSAELKTISDGFDDNDTTLTLKDRTLSIQTSNGENWVAKS